MHVHESLFDIVRFQSRSSRRFLVLDHTRADAGTGTGSTWHEQQGEACQATAVGCVYLKRDLDAGPKLLVLGDGTRTITGLILVLVVTDTSSYVLNR
jgi:hypothetical protein